jgi:hypothetical protein
MTKISLEKNFYVYGKFYDPNKVQVPKGEDNFDIIVYASPLSEKNRIISSLEGYFYSEIPLIKEGDNGVRPDWNPLVQRKQMEEFEEKYKGKFVPFER